MFISWVWETVGWRVGLRKYCSDLNYVFWYAHGSGMAHALEFKSQGGRLWGTIYIYDIFLLKAALALSVNCGMPELKSYIKLLYYAESVVKSLSWKHCVRKCWLCNMFALRDSLRLTDQLIAAWAASI